MKPFSVLSLAGLLTVSALAVAEEPGIDAPERTVVVENVKFDYAHVLNVEPVFQVLLASRTEEQCEPISTRTLDPVKVVGDEKGSGGLGRLWSSVRRMFGADDAVPAEAPVVPAELPVDSAMRRDPLLTKNCRIVEVGREFRRPIAYDVDYVYRGTKYRSRLPEDPGNRLRIRVSVTPILPSLGSSAVNE